MFDRDGGSVFPYKTVIYPNSGLGQKQEVEIPGMSLRDYFAGQALIGMSAAMIKNGYPRPEYVIEGEHEVNIIAETAYILADAMIAARGEK